MDEKPKDLGVDKQWLTALLESEIEKPKKWAPDDVKEMTATRPQSRMQEILQAFYWKLVDTLDAGAKFNATGEVTEAPDEDLFDSWYGEMKIDDYSQRYKLFQFFNTVARALHVTEETGSGEAKEIKAQLKRIAAKCVEEREYTDAVKDVINDKYPGLAGKYRSEPSVKELNEIESLEYDKKVNEISTDIESNIDKYSKQLAKIKKAEKTDFEKIAQDLNTIVIFGESRWELLLYCLMSPHAPRIYINRPLTQRANLHTLLAGDISTAKSKILKIAKVIAPKMMVVDETTKASFEGVAPTKSGGEIEDGLIDQAQDGVMITEELTSDFIRNLGGLFRRVMDCEPITFYKKGSTKDVNVNTTMLAACNPVDDFFIEETEFRKQIKFKEGILSRFDIVIPMMATQLSNDMLLPKMSLMSDKLTDELDLGSIRDNLLTIVKGMANVKEVQMSSQQEEIIKDAFRGRNQFDRERRILKNRPLVIFRDLETLSRLVNTIAAVNFSKRKINSGILMVDDSDIEKAVQLWENLIQLRVQLYSQHDRNMRSVSDEILLFVMRTQDLNEAEDVDIEVVRQEIVETRRLVGLTTFYKEIKTLQETGRVLVQGLRNKKLRVIVK